MKKEHADVLTELLRRGIHGGDVEAYLNDNWDTRRHQVIIPGGKYDRILLPETDGGILTDTGYLSYDELNRRWKITPKGVEFALQTVEYTPHNVQEVLEETLDRAVFHPLPDDHPQYPNETPIPWLYKPGSGRLVLVLGENAGGKSFFRRVLQLLTHRGKKNQWGKDTPRGPFPVQEMIHISMEGRTKGGMGSSFIYGNENWRSTGENSTRTVSTGVKTANGRGHTCIMYWDEPDIGMSAGTAAGAGQVIAQFATEASPLVQMVCVTSHSPALVSQLRHLDPHYIYLGNVNGPSNLDAWFEYQLNPVPMSPEEVQKASQHRFQLIQQVLNG